MVELVHPLAQAVAVDHFGEQLVTDENLSSPVGLQPFLLMDDRATIRFGRADGAGLAEAVAAVPLFLLAM